MPIPFSFKQFEYYRKLDGDIARLAYERYKKFPYELTSEQMKEVMRELRKREKEKLEFERKRVVEQAREEAGKETWRMNTEDYFKYILEQREKQRLLGMIRGKR